MPFRFESIEEGELIHHSNRIRWTEESFLDIPESEGSAPSHFLGVFHRRYRTRIFAAVVFGVVALFLSRAFYLQILQGSYYAGAAEKNRIRVIVDRATRGLILDREGRTIVANRPEFILTVMPHALPRDEDALRAVLNHVARILHEPPFAVGEEVSALPQDPFVRRQALPFREHIDYVTALGFMAAEEDIPGFRVEAREQRVYPETYVSEGVSYAMPESLAHIVGYLGKIDIGELAARQKQEYLASDLVGRAGIERQYETALHGKHGKRFVEINALGEEKTAVGSESAMTGKTLTLSIDLDVQRVLENALARAVLALPKRERGGAAAIALDPRNGAIRALVSLPAYNVRIFSGKTAREDVQKLLTDPKEPLFSRATSGEYPSGSTIKPLMALAALEEGVITSAATFLSTGGIAVGPWFFPDWKEGGHGATDVRRAIAESVNTFFYIIGGGYQAIPGLGMDRIETWMRKFSFGRALGIDLPQEAGGLVPTPAWKKEKRGEIWYIGDTYHLAIGQGDILATPLQIAAMTSVFANGGTLWRPTLVAGEPPVALAESLGSPNHVQVVREGMRRAVTGGSARFLDVLPVAVAGKTGTAEWSSKRPPHAWFTGFAPYRDPELVVTVLVEEGGEGSATAVPIAYEVFREYFLLIVKKI